MIHWNGDEIHADFDIGSRVCTRVRGCARGTRKRAAEVRRFRLHHHYYPRQRTAYGPRDRSRQRVHVHLAEEVGFTARQLCDQDTGYGRSLAEHLGLTFEALPMPRGGHRLVVYCPRCGERRRVLYALGTSKYHPLQCRECLGLVYWRQYEGRRLEAANAMGFPERAVWAAGRYRGWRPAYEVWQWRSLEHNARADLALALNLLEWQRYMAWCARLDELNAAVMRGESYWQTRRNSEHTATVQRLDKRWHHLRRQYARRSKSPRRKMAHAA